MSEPNGAEGFALIVFLAVGLLGLIIWTSKTEEDKDDV